MWGYVRVQAAVTYLHFELGMWHLGVFDPGFWYMREEHEKSEVEMGLCVNTPSPFPVLSEQTRRNVKCFKNSLFEMKTHLLCLSGRFYLSFSPPSQMIDPDTPPQMTFWGKTLGKYFLSAHYFCLPKCGLNNPFLRKFAQAALAHPFLEYEFVPV